jgi:undecaprenyl diphosphate synthase
VHLGLILDGNRRWAKANGLPPQQGHRRGYETLHEIVRAAADRGVRYISAYTFSTENWERSREEVDFLMDLMVWVATKEIDKFAHEGFRVLFVGSRERLTPKVIAAIESAEARTAANTGAVLALCFNYGGQVELAEGVARLVADGVPAAEVTPAKLAEYLYHPELPPIDLVIRTSGEQRTSGFMLWRSAYAELYFIEKAWPEFTADDLDEALAEYARRGRRFGK